MNKTALSMAAAIAALSALTACGDGAELDVKILTPDTVSTDAQNPLQNVTTLVFKVFDADTHEIIQSVTASRSEGKVSLSDLPTGRTMRIRATGYSGPSVVSWGESQRFTLPEGASDKTISAVIALRKVNTWSPVLTNAGGAAHEAKLNKPRAGHTATLLDDGRILLIGGFMDTEETPSFLPSAEVIDPASGEVVRLDSEDARRAHHTAVRMDSGDILVSGGISSVTQSTGASASYTRGDQSLFDQKEMAWKSVSLPRFDPDPRSQHTAVKLSNGTVLFFGGYGEAGALAAPGQTIYRPIENAFSNGATPLGGRVGHAMTTINSGQYPVVTGGRLEDDELSDQMLIIAEDGAIVTRTVTKRMHPAIVSYQNGVFTLGGFDESGTPLATTEFKRLLDTGSGTSSGDPVTSNLSEARGRLCAVLLGNGSILAAGGESASGASGASELFSPGSDSGLSVQVTDSLQSPRYLHTCTLLENGQLVVTGGIDSTGSATQSMEIYTPKPVDYPEW